jgi:RNA polymerase sigma factor (sigma-70 family)
MKRMSGRRSEYEERFRELFDGAYDSAFRILRDSGQSEDVALEVLTRAFLRWALVRAHAEAWTSRVAYRLAIDVWRRRSREGAFPDWEIEVPDATGSLDDRLAVSEALRTLPSRQREVVVLRYFAGLSESEIAGALGCSPGSVKRHSSRALLALRKRLKSQEFGSIYE